MQNKHKKVENILTWILYANLFVTIIKIFTGQYYNIISITADGVHSLTDSASNILGIISLRLSSSPPDKEHPYGHKKIEMLAAFAIGLLIIVGMFEIGSMSFESLKNTKKPDINIVSVSVLFITLFINIVVATYESNVGKELKSPILIADAKHTYSDCLATIVAIIGVIGAYLHIQYSDICASLVVMCFILMSAIEIFKSSINSILDGVQTDVSKIKAITLQIDGIIDCHAIRSRGQADNIFLDMHILVDPNMTIKEGHDLSHIAIKKIKEAIPEIVDVVIHVEPSNDNDAPDYEKSHTSSR